LAQLRQDYAEFVAREAEVVVVGPDTAGAFQTYFTEHDLPFTGLPDPKHTVLKRYGQEIRLFKMGRMPAQVVVDRQGVARFVHYGHSMADIPENEAILALLEAMNQTGGTPPPGDKSPGD